MKKPFVLVICIISFVMGIGLMHLTNNYLVQERSLSAYAKAISLKAEQKYSEALLSACDSATWNHNSYSPLILIADIISLERKSKEISREIYMMALQVARRNKTEQSEFDIERLQEKIGSSALGE